MASDAGVLTIEYKVNLLAPGKGDRVEAHAWVVRPGRTITVTRGDAYAYDGNEQTRVATMQATVMTVTGRDDVRG
jgi:acyl-coenzyme A thioesterase PaaI-like protein